MKSENKDIMIILIGIGFILGTIVIFYSSRTYDNNNEILAQKIIDFRNTEYSCNTIKKLYLKAEPTKYSSMNNVVWFNEVRDKLIDAKCITNEELNELEFIKMCMDSRIVGCEISKIKHPELYENFEFLTFEKNSENFNKKTKSQNNRKVSKK